MRLLNRRQCFSHKRSMKSDWQTPSKDSKYLSRERPRNYLSRSKIWRPPCKSIRLFWIRCLLAMRLRPTKMPISRWGNFPTKYVCWTTRTSICLNAIKRCTRILRSLTDASYSMTKSTSKDWRVLKKKKLVLMSKSKNFKKSLIVKNFLCRIKRKSGFKLSKCSSIT